MPGSGALLLTGAAAWLAHSSRKGKGGRGAGLLAVLWLAYKTWRSQRGRRMAPGRFQFPGIGETVQFAMNPAAQMANGLSKNNGSFFANLLFNPTTVVEPTKENLKFVTLQQDVGWPDHWKDVVGRNSLAMVNGAIHRKMRSVSGRAFTAESLDSYLPRFQKSTKAHLSKWAKLPSGTKMYEHVKYYTFELAQTIILGIDMKEDDCKDMAKDFKTATDGLECLVPVNLPGFPYYNCLQARARLVRKYQAIIDQKRAALKSSQTSGDVKNISMLDHVMSQSEKQGSEEATDIELQDFCFTMAFAGHDTTLATMQNMLHLLDASKPIVEELRREVAAVWDGETLVTRALLNQLHKCKAFTLEALRIVPPVQTVFRKLNKDAALPTGSFEVPSETTVAVGIRTVMDKSIGASDEVRLEHWLDSTGAFTEKSITDFTRFSAFGGGGRMCIGYKFAMDEMLVFLMTLLRGYDFAVVKRERQHFPFNQHNIWASISPRASSPFADNVMGA